MTEIYNGSHTCINCGGSIPGDVSVRTEDDYASFRCSKCDRVVAERLLSKHGEPADAPYPPPNYARKYPIAESVTWTTWEVWWTNTAAFTLINGRPIEPAPEILSEFISHLEAQL